MILKIKTFFNSEYLLSKVILGLILVLIFSVVFGSAVYASFIRIETPLSGFSYGYGYGYGGSNEYGYGYGYGRTEGLTYSEYGFEGTDGSANIDSVLATKTTLYVTYTTSYTAISNTLEWGLDIPYSDSIEFLEQEAGTYSYLISGLECGNSYYIGLTSQDSGGNDWSANERIDTSSCGGGGSSSGSVVSTANVVTTTTTNANNIEEGETIDCPSELVITDFMQEGDRDGKYSADNNGIVTQVSSLQSYINRILGSSFVEASGQVDGIFGFLTKRGVERLQIEFNKVLKPSPLLAIDGVVGPLTRKAINNSCKISLDNPQYVFSKNLEIGMSDFDVQKLQEFLNNKGYKVAEKGVGSKGEEGTYFGVGTRDALVKFQIDNNITPFKGYFGEKTRALINNL